MMEKRFSGTAEQLRSPERRERLEVDRVVDLCLEGITVAAVVDIGVGSGVFAESFDRRGIAIWGVDVQPEMVAAAQHYVPRGHFQHGVAEALPFSHGAVDLAFLGLLLHEVEDPAQVLREAHRVASRRVAVLEWPYRAEAFGPPVDHRLRSEDVEAAARAAGFAAITEIPLASLVLYLMDATPPASARIE